jgi:hypothetical protein
MMPAACSSARRAVIACVSFKRRYMRADQGSRGAQLPARWELCGQWTECTLNLPWAFRSERLTSSSRKKLARRTTPSAHDTRMDGPSDSLVPAATETLNRPRGRPRGQTPCFPTRRPVGDIVPDTQQFVACEGPPRVESTQRPHGRGTTLTKRTLREPWRKPPVQSGRASLRTRPGDVDASGLPNDF